MPVYEFECESCGKQFELTMTITEHDRLKERPVACPECGESRNRQLVSSFNCNAPSKY